MNRKILPMLLAAALMLPGLASAASFTNVQFENGDTSIDGTGGTTVNATFHMVVPANEVVEQIQTDVIGDNLAPVCVSAGDNLGYQQGTYDITLPIKLPMNTNTYSLAVQGSGIYGAFRAVDCSSNVVGSASFNGALRVVADGSNTSTGTGSPAVGTAAWFQDQIAALTAAIAALSKPAPAPTTSAVCTAYAQANTGTQYGVKNDANTRLQGFLLSQGASIPALAAGASFGFDGPQTEAARATFVNTNHCI